MDRSLIIKNVIVEIKEKIKERIKIKSNLTSSPTHLSKTRELRGELNISSFNPPDYSHYSQSGS